MYYAIKYHVLGRKIFIRLKISWSLGVLEPGRNILLHCTRIFQKHLFVNLRSVWGQIYDHHWLSVTYVSCKISAWIHLLHLSFLCNSPLSIMCSLHANHLPCPCLPWICVLFTYVCNGASHIMWTFPNVHVLLLPNAHSTFCFSTALLPRRGKNSPCKNSPVFLLLNKLKHCSRTTKAERYRIVERNHWP